MSYVKNDTGLSAGRLPLGLLVASLFIAAAFLLVYPVVDIASRVSRDYNEGWNAFQVLRLLSGGPLYPADPFVTNNYPPLSFLVVGAVTAMTNDAVVAGRVVALLSLFLTALNVGLIGHRLTGSRTLGAFASAYFLTYAGIWFAAFIAMADPQWIGHALQTTGLYVLVRHDRERLSTSRLGACAVMMCLGGLVKHNLVVLPIATLAWLLWLDRRVALRFVVLGLICVAVSLTACFVFFGAAFFDAILGHARVISAANLSDRVSYTVMAIAPSLLLVAVLGQLAGRDPRVRLCAIYLLISVGVGLLSRAGTGVDFNAYFDVGIAAALVASLAVYFVTRSARESMKPVMAVSAALLIAATFVSDVSPAREAFKGAKSVHTREAEATELIELLKSTDGPIACEQLAYCYWAGKPPELDFFNYGQKLLTGRLDEGALAARFEGGYFKLILVRELSDIERHFGNKRVARAIHANYRVERELASMIVLRAMTDHQN